MILIVLVLVSLLSLATGKRASFIRDGVRTVVSVTAYPFLKLLNGIEHGFDYAAGLVLSYHDARREVESLRLRLGETMQHAAERNELRQENERLRHMLQFVRGEPRLTLEPVRVLESFKGILMIDRGSFHGVRESMCAVNEDGIIGIITQADPATANIATLYNADCKVGAMIARNRVRGIIHGRASELSPYCTMNYIDMKDDVAVGDAVVASSESIFPAGYPIGKVVAVHDTKSLWKSADVEPAVDPYRLDEVLILRQAAPAAEEPTGTASSEAVALPAADAPATRSLQERYAP